MFGDDAKQGRRVSHFAVDHARSTAKGVQGSDRDHKIAPVFEVVAIDRVEQVFDEGVLGEFFK